jgi:hypothetical protein
MGIKSALGVRAGSSLRAVADLGPLIRRVAAVLLPTSRESMPLDLLASNCLPYQASKTYRTIVTEADCNRAQAMVEVQRTLGFI